MNCKERHNGLIRWDCFERVTSLVRGTPRFESQVRSTLVTVDLSSIIWHMRWVWAVSWAIALNLLAELLGVLKLLEVLERKSICLLFHSHNLAFLLYFGLDKLIKSFLALLSAWDDVDLAFFVQFCIVQHLLLHLLPFLLEPVLLVLDLLGQKELVLNGAWLVANVI